MAKASVQASSKHVYSIRERQALGRLETITASSLDSPADYIDAYLCLYSYVQHDPHDVVVTTLASQLDALVEAIIDHLASNELQLVQAAGRVFSFVLHNTITRERLSDVQQARAITAVCELLKRMSGLRSAQASVSQTDSSTDGDRVGGDPPDETATRLAQHSASYFSQLKITANVGVWCLARQTLPARTIIQQFNEVAEALLCVASAPFNSPTLTRQVLTCLTMLHTNDSKRFEIPGLLKQVCVAVMPCLLADDAKVKLEAYRLYFSWLRRLLCTLSSKSKLQVFIATAQPLASGMLNSFGTIEDAHEALVLWVDMWRVFGVLWHRSTAKTAVNSMLKVIQQALHIVAPAIRNDTWACLIVMMANFCLNPKVFVSSSRLDLISKILSKAPLVASTEATRVRVWCVFITLLRSNVQQHLNVVTLLLKHLDLLQHRVEGSEYAACVKIATPVIWDVLACLCTPNTSSKQRIPQKPKQQSAESTSATTHSTKTASAASDSTPMLSSSNQNSFASAGIDRLAHLASVVGESATSFPSNTPIQPQSKRQDDVAGTALDGNAGTVTQSPTPETAQQTAQTQTPTQLPALYSAASMEALDFVISDVLQHLNTTSSFVPPLSTWSPDLTEPHTKTHAQIRGQDQAQACSSASLAGRAMQMQPPTCAQTLGQGQKQTGESNVKEVSCVRPHTCEWLKGCHQLLHPFWDQASTATEFQILSVLICALRASQVELETQQSASPSSRITTQLLQLLLQGLAKISMSLLTINHVLAFIAPAQLLQQLDPVTVESSQISRLVDMLCFKLLSASSFWNACVWYEQYTADFGSEGGALLSSQLLHSLTRAPDSTVQRGTDTTVDSEVTSEQQRAEASGSTMARMEYLTHGDELNCSSTSSPSAVGVDGCSIRKRAIDADMHLSTWKQLLDIAGQPVSNVLPRTLESLDRVLCILAQCTPTSSRAMYDGSMANAVVGASISSSVMSALDPSQPKVSSLSSSIPTTSTASAVAPRQVAVRDNDITQRTLLGQGLVLGGVQTQQQSTEASIVPWLYFAAHQEEVFAQLLDLTQLTRSSSDRASSGSAPDTQPSDAAQSDGLLVCNSLLLPLKNRSLHTTPVHHIKTFASQWELVFSAAVQWYESMHGTRGLLLSRVFPALIELFNADALSNTISLFEAMSAVVVTCLSHLTFPVQLLGDKMEPHEYSMIETAAQLAAMYLQLYLDISFDQNATVPLSPSCDHLLHTLGALLSRVPSLESLQTILKHLSPPLVGFLKRVSAQRISRKVQRLDRKRAAAAAAAASSSASSLSSTPTAGPASKLPDRSTSASTVVDKEIKSTAASPSSPCKEETRSTTTSNAQNNPSAASEPSSGPPRPAMLSRQRSYKRDKKDTTTPATDLVDSPVLRDSLDEEDSGAEAYTSATECESTTSGVGGGSPTSSPSVTLQPLHVESSSKKPLAHPLREKVTTLWKEVANSLRKLVRGMHEVSPEQLLEDLTPLLEVTMPHVHADIERAALLTWNQCFSSVADLSERFPRVYAVLLQVHKNNKFVKATCFSASEQPIQLAQSSPPSPRYSSPPRRRLALGQPPYSPPRRSPYPRVAHGSDSSGQARSLSSGVQGNQDFSSRAVSSISSPGKSSIVGRAMGRVGILSGSKAASSSALIAAAMNGDAVLDSPLMTDPACQDSPPAQYGLKSFPAQQQQQQRGAKDVLVDGDGSGGGGLQPSLHCDDHDDIFRQTSSARRRKATRRSLIGTLAPSNDETSSPTTSATSSPAASPTKKAPAGFQRRLSQEDASLFVTVEPKKAKSTPLLTDHQRETYRAQREQSKDLHNDESLNSQAEAFLQQLESLDSDATQHSQGPSQETTAPFSQSQPAGGGLVDAQPVKVGKHKGAGAMGSGMTCSAVASQEELVSTPPSVVAVVTATTPSKPSPSSILKARRPSRSSSKHSPHKYHHIHKRKVTFNLESNQHHFYDVQEASGDEGRTLSPLHIPNIPGTQVQQQKQSGLGSPRNVMTIPTRRSDLGVRSLITTSAPTSGQWFVVNGIPASPTSPVASPTSSSSPSKGGPFPSPRRATRGKRTTQSSPKTAVSKKSKQIVGSRLGTGRAQKLLAKAVTQPNTVTAPPPPPASPASTKASTDPK
eukprot:m.269099 g.269099  ORF g.269099 m.269099 type:complete len:2120 (+) comp15665_c2_seq7:304-6663(+)